MIEGMIRLINMTFTAGCTVLFVLVIRLLFRKLPKGYSYALWFIVLFRFLCPVAVPSPFSLLPVYPEPMPREIVYEKTPEIESGVIWVDRAVNQVLERNLSAEGWETASANPIQIALFVLAVVWQAGVLVLLLSYMTHFLRLRRRLAAAGMVEKGVYECSQIEGAFVMGLFRPAVYLPAGLDEENRRYILRHEKIHIRRRDYLVKLLGLCVVLVHWFNPLSWLAFRLLCKDMEMSCDEQVLKELGEEGRKTYSLALLHAAERQSGLLLPLAFGESHTRSRIKNVLNYRRPRFWITALATVTVVAAGAGLMTNPAVKKTVEETGNEMISFIGGGDGPTSLFVAGKTAEGEPVVFDKMPDTPWLAETTIPASFPGEEQEGQPALDYASKDQVIFHGDFGLFAFRRQGNQWNLTMHVTEEDFPDFNKVVESLTGNANWQSRDSIHREDRLIGAGDSFSFRGALPEEGWQDAAAQKMEDGSIAVLGGYRDGESIRLIDLFYGYYHPEDQVFHQVYLFGGNRETIVNRKGDTNERRYLFSREGADYYVRTPKTLLAFEKEEGIGQDTFHFPYGRLELVRYQGGMETVLDDMMCMQGLLEHQKVVVADDRIVYTGAASTDRSSFMNPGLVSIAMDGSDRRAADIPHHIYHGLSYEGGYLYYQGWTDHGAMPRPLYRMTPDFERQEYLADLDGSLMTVKEGGIAYVYNWKRRQVEVCGVENKGTMWRFDHPGGEARHHQVETEQVGDILTIILKPLDVSKSAETYRIYVPDGF